MNSLVAACIQMRSGRTPAQNFEQLEPLVRQAVSEGAEYILTPEISNFSVRDKKEMESLVCTEEEDIFVIGGEKLARDLSIWLHFGSLIVRSEAGKIVNRSVLISPEGELTARYDKIHMFDVDLPGGESWRESNHFEPGEMAVVSRLPFANIGLSICYDVRFPQLYRSLVRSGATILTIPAAFTQQTGQAHWHVLLRARAIENFAFVMAAAQGGKHEDGRETYGHSMIIDPWGQILAEADGDKPAYIIARLDLNDVNTTRNRIPALKNERHFSQPVKLKEKVLEPVS